MHRATERRTVVVDRYTRFCLTAIAILLTVLIVGLWAAAPVGPNPTIAAPAGTANASAEGIGNPSAQRMAIRRAIDTTNQKLGEIVKLLESGKIKVTVVQQEAENAPPKAKRAGK